MVTMYQNPKSWRRRSVTSVPSLLSKLRKHKKPSKHGSARIHVTVRTLGGSSIDVKLGLRPTYHGLKAAIKKSASVGPLAFKLITEGGVALDSECDILSLNRATVTLVTLRARDYVQIKPRPEIVNTRERAPVGILVDDTGEVMVIHSFGWLSVYDRSMDLVQMQRLPCQHPQQLVRSPSGHVVIVFDQKIGVFEPATYQPLRWFGSLSCARGLAFDGDRVFVSDIAENKICVYRFDDGELLSTHFLGLQAPCGLAVVDGRLLAVAERGRSRVLLLDLQTLAVISQLPREGAPESHLLGEPNDVKTDAAGNLLVMDTGGERIAIFQEDGTLVASVMEGFFENTGNTHNNLYCNHATGAIAATHSGKDCIAMFSPIF